MEMNVSELQVLNQNNPINESTGACRSQGTESSSSTFTSYLSRETESLEQQSFSSKKENNIHADTQGNERYRDVHEHKTSPDNTMNQDNSKVQEKSSTQSTDIHEYHEEPQSNDDAFDNSSIGVNVSDQDNSEMSDTADTSQCTVSCEETSGENDEQGTEDSMETVGVNLLITKQIPAEIIVINNEETKVTGESKVEIKTPASDKSGGSDAEIKTPGSDESGGSDAEIKTPGSDESGGSDAEIKAPASDKSGGSDAEIKAPGSDEAGESDAEIKAPASEKGIPGLDNKEETRIEVASKAVDSDNELQSPIEELSPGEEQLPEAEDIKVEDLSQKDIDREGAPKISSENNSQENNPEKGAFNQEDKVGPGDTMSDKGNGQRHSDEKSGNKNPVAEAAHAVKDTIKPGAVDESDGIHALNKNIKEMMHRHSVTGSSELKTGASTQSVAEIDTGMMHHLSSSADIAAVSKSADSPLLASVNRPAGIAELLDSIVYAVKGNNRLGVTIEHSELGKLNINLSLDKGNVHVNIHASDKVTKEIIENNIQYIIDSLEKEGVSISGFSVGTKGHQEKIFQSPMSRNGRIKVCTESVETTYNRNGLVSVFA